MFGLYPFEANCDNINVVNGIVIEW
jgi:hypothetical protein